MIFDVNNLFFHTGSQFAFTAGEFVSLAGSTGSFTTGNVINLGVAEDLGIGDGVAIPKVALYIGTGITSASTSMTLNFQFQGSTDSANWTTYVESGALTTASLTAGAKVFPIDVPHRPAGAALPLYYRINIAGGGTTGTPTISSGTIIGGIVIQRDDNSVGQYPSNFVVAA